MKAERAALSAVAWLTLVGCTGEHQEPLVPRLDLLFVIDDSGAMHEEQDGLKQGLPALTAALARAAGGMPDTHIAVISSDYGAGSGETVADCRPRGDGGRFQVRPACGLEGSAYLTIDAAGNRNFQGELPEVVGCLTTLGAGGCLFEHTLQSLRAALAAPDNQGFLRQDAVLGIVILSNEDDCSGEEDATFFEGAVPGQGPSVRCGLLGHVCDGQPVVASEDFRAPLASCAPYRRRADERTSRLIDVEDFVAAVKAHKGGDEDRIVVASIVGWDDGPDARYAFHERNSVFGGVDVYSTPVCVDQVVGSAEAAVRLVGFTRSFRRNTVHPICAYDLAPALKRIGDEIALAFEAVARR
jgi:hypothetical protein